MHFFDQVSACILLASKPSKPRTKAEKNKNQNQTKHPPPPLPLSWRLSQ